MVSEARSRALARFYNILVAWYSSWLIALTIIDLRNPLAGGHGVVLVILSIFVFGLSLIIPGLAFDERAVRHRECYLRLQRLRGTDLPDAEKTEKYHDILEGYPNHQDIDWDVMMVTSKWRGQSLENNAGPIIATRWQFWKVVLYRVGIYILAAVLMTLPLAVLKTF